MDEEGEDCVDIRRVQVDEESSKCSKAKSQTQRTQGEKTREGEDCVDIRRVQVDEESSKFSKAKSQTQRTQGEKTRDSDFEQERIYIQSSPSRCPKSTKRKEPEQSMKSNIASTSSSKIQHDEKKKNKEIVMENDTEIDKRKRMDILRTKTSPITLHETIAELSNKQKNVVKGMGLGSILDMALTGVPSKLGFYVVDNLDTKSMQLKLKNGVIPITVESIHRVLGLPMGGIDLIGQKEIHEEMNFITQWIKQFEKKKMRPTDVMSLIVESAESGFNFKLNFLVLFVNLMAECSTMGYCNYGFLRRIRNEYMIKEIDWCRYIYEKIRKSKARWIRESTTCYYAGPLTYLALLYVESTVSPWVEVGISGNALASWTMELLEKRETTEIRDGGLGLLPSKRKTKEEYVQHIVHKLAMIQKAKFKAKKLISAALTKFPNEKEFHEFKDELDSIFNSDMRKKRRRVAVEQGRRWVALHPEILALIFVKIPPHEMLMRVPFVCKSWNEVVLGPYCWRDIDVSVWCEIRNDNDPVKVDRVLEKLVQRSNYTARQLCTFDMGVLGFSSIANCGRCLISLVMPVANITDDMVLKHIKPLPHLKHLDISYCFQITHKGIAAFGKNCKSLINLKRCMFAVPFEQHSSPEDDSEAKAVADTMPSLKWLQLCAGNFGKPGLFEILAKCKSLTHLDIYESWNVDLDDAEFKGITEKLRMFLY